MSSALASLCDHLEQLATISAQFIAACERGDEQDLRRWLTKSRVTRARVARAQSEVIDDGVPESPEDCLLLGRARSLMPTVAPGTEAIKLWLERPLPPDEQLLSSAEGVAAWTDSMLPIAWEYATDLVVLVGPGLEAAAKELVRQGQERLIAVVPDGIEHSYPSEVIVAADGPQISAAVLQMVPDPPARIVSKQHHQFGMGHKEHRKLIMEAEEAISEIGIHFNTVNNFADTWVSQGVANLPAATRWPSIDTLRSTFAGKPMVIVAPGPSLAKNIHLLPALKGKAVIVTFSHTMKALHDAGVVPDLVMCVDPQDVRYHFAGVAMDQVAAVVNGITVHPELFNVGAPRYVTFGANSALDDWVYGGLGENARVLGGGSVATSACALGLIWDCAPIVFVGLDLSFPNGKCYITSSCDGDATVELTDDGDHMVVKGWSQDYHKLDVAQKFGEDRTERVVMLPGYHGGEVQSNFVFSLFHRWFEKRVADHPDRFINCTEGGAQIAGTRQAPLAEIAEELADREVNVGVCIDAAMDTMDLVGRKATTVERVRAMLAAVDAVDEAATRCHELAERASKDPRALAELDAAEKALNTATQPVMFLSLLRQRAILDAMRQATAATTVQETLRASCTMYSVIRDTARWLRPRLQTIF